MLAATALLAQLAATALLAQLAMYMAFSFLNGGSKPRTYRLFIHNCVQTCSVFRGS